MRILYGVQATGQGHISRARAMAEAFRPHDIEVCWLFSGRPRERLFDMEPFGHYRYRRGLTFATQAGRLRRLDTLRTNDFRQFFYDVRHLDLSPFDLVVTDYEPVVAWAARRAGVRSIGIGHQYAFGPATPVSGGDLVSRLIMRRFAPVAVPVGLHWHPYAANVLPPILDLPPLAERSGDHVLVYLPFEDQEEVTRLLQGIPGQRFVQYANGLRAGIAGNVVHKPTSTATFKLDLRASAGVICNAGFELISECLQWGKPVLTRPLAGQMEQLSNAEALRQLGYATVLNKLATALVADWLHAAPATPALRFPDVSSALAGWLAVGAGAGLEDLWRQLWDIPPRNTPRGSDDPFTDHDGGIPERKAG